MNKEIFYENIVEIAKNKCKFNFDERIIEFVFETIEKTPALLSVYQNLITNNQNLNSEIAKKIRIAVGGNNTGKKGLSQKTTLFKSFTLLSQSIDSLPHSYQNIGSVNIVDDEFEAQVNKTFDIFQRIVAKNLDKLNKNADNIFLNTVLNCNFKLISSKDTTRAKFAIISSYFEWEGLYQERNSELPLCLGEYCCDIMYEKGLKYYNLTGAELGFLRQEVIYGNKHYSNYLLDIKDFSDDYKKLHLFNSLFVILSHYMVLKRYPEAKAIIEEFRTFRETEPDAEICCIIFAANYYNEAGICETDINDVCQVLKSFQANDESNRLFGQYNPITYIHVWIDLINDYLHALENIFDNDEGQGNISTALTNIFSSSNSALRKFSPKFVASLSNDELDLMKKHDELLIELVQYLPNEIIDPYFRGTEIILWHKRLNLSYPEKLEYFIWGDGVIKAGYKHKYNMSNDKLMERLISEFPESEIKIRESLSPRDDFDIDDVADDDSDTKIDSI
jgi:hypothetical protein